MQLKSSRCPHLPPGPEDPSLPPSRPAAPASQAGAGVGNRFGMLNIKQAKPGVSGPEATRAALQSSRESPRVYMAGWGWGRAASTGGGMLSAKSPPTLHSRRGVGIRGVLQWGQGCAGLSGPSVPPPHAGKLPLLQAPERQGQPQNAHFQIGRAHV